MYLQMSACNVSQEQRLSVTRLIKLIHFRLSIRDKTNAGIVFYVFCFMSALRGVTTMLLHLLAV